MPPICFCDCLSLTLHVPHSRFSLHYYSVSVCAVWIIAIKKEAFYVCTHAHATAYLDIVECRVWEGLSPSRTIIRRQLSAILLLHAIFFFCFFLAISWSPLPDHTVVFFRPSRTCVCCLFAVFTLITCICFW